MSNESYPITATTPPKQRYGCWTVGGFIVLIALNLGVLFWWVFGSDAPVASWDPQTTTRGLAFSPDNQLLAVPTYAGSSRSTDESYSVILYNVWDGKEVQHIAGESSRSVAFRSDGGLLATGGNDGIVRIWSMPEGQLIAELGGHTSYVSSIAFSPDGQMLASISDNGEVFLWDINTSTLIRTYNIEIGFDGSVSFNSDGRFLAAKGSHTWIWSVDDGQLLHQIPVRLASFSPDGQFLITEFQLLRVDDLSVVRDYELDGYNQASSIAVSPNGELFSVVGFPSMTGFIHFPERLPIYLWRVEDGKKVQSLRGHIDGALSITFSPDGRLVATGGNDGMVRIWRVGIFWPQRLIIFGLVVGLQIFIVRKMAS